MTLALKDLGAEVNALAAHYTRFDVANRLLLTGHSHQAWPDVALTGQIEAFEDAARYVDDKWPRAFDRAQRFREHLRRLLNDPDGCYAFASATHDLLVRVLSSLDLSARPRLITTTGEYHSARRQLDRLNELDAIQVVKISATDPEALTARLGAAVDDRTAAVYVSHVLFKSARIVPGLDELARQCDRNGAALIVDMYHSINVLDATVQSLGLQRAFVLGGGYKYLQCGEGNCFLRFPADCTARPAVTGWYAEFSSMEKSAGHAVGYAHGDGRFAGATYDPTSHYRAVPVLDFFVRHELHPALLRQISQHQVGLLAREFDALDLDPKVITRDWSIPLESIAGFLALDSPVAGTIVKELHSRGVMCDHRETTLRLGPAPYLSDRQLRDAVAALGEVARSMMP